MIDFKVATTGKISIDNDKLFDEALKLASQIEDRKESIALRCLSTSTIKLLIKKLHAELENRQDV